jgi:NTE family protein
MHSTYGKIALLLNGAGANGLIQAGMVQAVVDHGIKYDTIYGSSAGSLNGIMLHQGQLAEMKQLWMNIKTSDIYRFGLWNPLKPKVALFDSSPLKKYLQKMIKPDLMRANPKNFVIAATDFSTWAAVHHEVKELTDEEMVQFLFASASPPVFFPPVEFRGDTLSDSGICANYNIAKAVEDGHDLLIDCGFAIPEPIPLTSIKDSITQTLSISMHCYFARELSFVEKINEILESIPANTRPERLVKVVKIVPEKSSGVSLLDFDYKQDREELWQSGYDLARDILRAELS